MLWQFGFIIIEQKRFRLCVHFGAIKNCMSGKIWETKSNLGDNF